MRFPLPFLAVKDEKEQDWNPWGMELDVPGKTQEAPAAINLHQPIDWQRDFGMKDIQEQDQQILGRRVVEIWGKAAIGEISN